MKARKTSISARPAARPAQRVTPARSPCCKGPSITVLTMSGSATCPAVDTIEVVTMTAMWTR